MTDADRSLMARIYTNFHPVLAAAANLSSIPEAFLAALIANESGGNVAAKRFESGVFASLGQVLLGRKAAYNNLRASEILGYVAPDETKTVMPNGFASCLQRLENLSSSWGPTQIMGWQPLLLGKPLFPLPVKDYIDFSVLLLTIFANRNQLDMTREFAELFACWNTGRPDGKTFDPQYVPNGLARMGIYDQIAKSAAPPQPQTA